MAVTDAQGRVTTLDVYRCDRPNCNKLFQTRNALATHQVRLAACRWMNKTFRFHEATCSLHCATAGLAQAAAQSRTDDHVEQASGRSFARDPAPAAPA